MSQTAPVQHEDSISSQDPHNDDKKKTKSRRPANTAFRQQRLKAWQPILTPKTVLPLFFVVGIIFAPIGALLLYASSQVKEISINYTQCNVTAPEVTLTDSPVDQGLADMDTDLVSQTFKAATVQRPQWGRAKANGSWVPGAPQVESDVCVLQFDIPEDVEPPIYFYYRLTNFYQNHRRYVKSFDFDQLQGKAVSASAVASGDCDPLQVDDSGYGNTGKPFYPCGLIANSMFNDTYDNLTLINAPGGIDEPVPYNMTQNGISWSTEGNLYKRSEYKPEDVVPPPNWMKQYPGGNYTSTGLPNLHDWEAFQVWMRTAGLPTFSKLAMRNDTGTMTVGRYELRIYNRFPVDVYGGTKEILISTRTIMGGKNPFLGIAYVVVGGLCILLGAVFTATHLIKPRKLGDHTYLSWNNDQPSTATATGRARPGDSA